MKVIVKQERDLSTEGMLGTRENKLKVGIEFVKTDPDEDEYVPSTIDKTLCDPLLNKLVHEDMKFQEISSDDDEWSPSNEDIDNRDSEDRETRI
ncbi:hypothetical protein L1887_11560 [Cichorium endivia]|nr:hypothetical protein L1887_11560 [Cichorium endivia]